MDNSEALSVQKPHTHTKQSPVCNRVIASGAKSLVLNPYCVDLLALSKYDLILCRSDCR